MWPEDPCYLNALKIFKDFVKSFKVTNDVAERAVGMTEDYNGRAVKEDQYQGLLHSTNKNRKMFSKCTKRTIAEGLRSI